MAEVLVANTSVDLDGKTLLTTDDLAIGEGAWTPFLTRSSTNPTITYTAQNGRYVRLGRLVLVGFRITLTGISDQGTGSWRLAGLPFPMRTGLGAQRYAASLGVCDLFAATGGEIFNADDFILLTNAGAPISVSAATTGQLNGSLVYEVEAA